MRVRESPVCDAPDRRSPISQMTALGQLETFPALPKMSVAGGKAEAIGRIADIADGASETEGLPALLLWRPAGRFEPPHRGRPSDAVGHIQRAIRLWPLYLEA